MRVGGPAAEKGRDRKKGTRSLALSSLRSAFFFGVLDAAWCSLFRWQRAGARSDFCAIPTCVGLSLFWFFGLLRVLLCLCRVVHTRDGPEKSPSAFFLCRPAHHLPPFPPRRQKGVRAHREHTPARVVLCHLFFSASPARGQKIQIEGAVADQWRIARLATTPKTEMKTMKKKIKNRATAAGPLRATSPAPFQSSPSFFFPTACRRKSRTGSRRGLGVLGH